MLGDSATSPQTKSSKRPSDSESSCRPRKQERKDGNNDSEKTSPPQNPTAESMEVSVQSDGTAELDLAENIIEVEVDFNEKKDKANLPKTGIPDVLNAEFALRNTSGGIIKLKMKTSLSSEGRGEKIDDWRKHLNKERNERLLTLGQKELDAEIIDFIPEDLLIFVKKSSIILTEKSNLYVRRGSERSELESYFKIENLFKKNSKPRCCCKDNLPVRSFVQGRQMPSGEGVSVEYKMLTSRKLADKMRKELSEYVAQFANTSGGYVYFGIADNGVIIGQHVNDQERQAIEYKIKCCMESKIWINKFGEKETPELGTHYAVTFFRVNGADDNTFVIQVHICHYAGAVFLKEPVCRVIDYNNQIGEMDFEMWLSFILKSVRTIEANGNDRSKLKRHYRGRTVYYTVNKSIEDIYSDLMEASPGKLKIRPSHALHSIDNPSLRRFVKSLNETFKKEGWEGILFIERCWGVNMGFPNTKPSDVVCDILVCSPDTPLLLVSLTEEATCESLEYNRKLATALKKMLAQDGGCKEKMYVKPVTLKADQVDISEMISRTPFYPNAYQMSEEKYAAIIDALVPVLARVNFSVKGAVGEKLFHVLTKDQYSILFENSESPKLMVTGPPGSGKTVMAIERIHRLRRQGFSDREILFVCSNKALEAHVRRNRVIVVGQSEPLCLMYNYFGISSCLSSRSRTRKQLAHVKHIVIDECQNFKQRTCNDPFDWWKRFVEFCDERKSSLWIFSDSNQQIIVEPCVLKRLPDGFSVRQLNTVIRTTGKIHRFICERFMKNGPRIHLGHDFEGEDVDVLVPKTPSEEHLVYMLISCLKDILKKGVHPNTIGVLFANKDKKKRYQTLFTQCTNGQFPVNDGEDVSKHGIVFDTIRVFSGCDKDTIIGFCPQFDPRSAFQNNDALMISLCSRAKLKLILILENEEVASSFGLADCMKEKVVE